MFKNQNLLLLAFIFIFSNKISSTGASLSILKGSVEYKALKGEINSKNLNELLVKIESIEKQIEEQELNSGRKLYLPRMITLFLKNILNDFDSLDINGVYVEAPKELIDKTNIFFSIILPFILDKYNSFWAIDLNDLSMVNKFVDDLAKEFNVLKNI